MGAEDQTDLDEAALSELSKKALARIREGLGTIPDQDLREYVDTFSKKREILSKVIRRPKDHTEVQLMKDRAELRDRLNLILGSIDGELARRRRIQSWNF